MKVAILVFATLAIILPSIRTNDDCPFKNEDNTNTNAQAQNSSREALYRGQQTFTLRLFEVINKIKEKDNVFFSPYSVYHALLLAFFTSANQTETNLRKALQLGSESKVDLMKAYQLDAYLRSVEPSESYIFDSANHVYVEETLPVRQCMLDFFQKEMEKLNFRAAPQEARVHINDWVANVTRNNIKDLIPTDGIDSDTQLVLVNAAHFKGLWASRFQPEGTSKEVFYITPERQTFVQMMRQKGKFNQGVNEQLGAHVLEMPYKGDEVSMFVLLPPFAKENGVDDILANLTPETLAEIVEEGHYMPRQVEVQFPKFSMEKTVQLKEVLTTMGVGDLFEPTSDFSYLTGTVGPHFNDAVHKAKINVDEDGTVASAATAVFSFRSSRPTEPTRFICNHPFVYFIYDKISNAVTFMGVFREPKMMS
uniref:Serpin n=1 Tax=Hesperophylax occidentalis TaxID=1546108 RepID=A0A088SGI7_9NEOP|nr:serpin [Hesperophylax occidentalis]